jgi:transposase
MSERKLLSKILRLSQMKVTDFKWRERGTELHLAVKPLKNGCRCPQCERRCPIVRLNAEARCWSDIAILGVPVFLWYAPKEVCCPTHGRAQEIIAWAAPHARVSYRLEYRICALCQIMTEKAAAATLKMATSTLSDLLHRVVTRVRAAHAIRGLVCLGVDEISYCKGRRFATLVYDLDRAKVVWVGQGKGRETIDRFFQEALSPYQRQQVRWASCDMSEAYIGAIKHHCPNATLVIDRFHVVKALNGALDEVRKEQWRQLDKPGRKAIRGLRWMLARNASHRTKADTRFLNGLRLSNNRIHRAWVLKDEFEHFWHFSYPAVARKFLKRWMTSALRTRIESMRNFVGTLRRHFENIVTFIDRPLTNAVGEGINRVIRLVKNRASGFRNLESFADLIFLTVGDYDIPDHVPSRLRTL